jgi:hypothetical protein
MGVVNPLGFGPLPARYARGQGDNVSDRLTPTALSLRPVHAAAAPPVRALRPRPLASPSAGQATELSGSTRDGPGPSGTLRRLTLEGCDSLVPIVDRVPARHPVKEVTAKARRVAAALIDLHRRPTFPALTGDLERLSPAACILADREAVVGTISDGDLLVHFGLTTGSFAGQPLGPERRCGEQDEAEQQDMGVHRILLGEFIWLQLEKVRA